MQSDGLRHPIAYASRGLSKAECNYGITELETLAVVWAVTHFRTYLYGNEVTVFTDHSAVKAVLETPNPSGKHARWWIKVYESGLKQVNIVYRPGKSNLSAEALSRSPVGNSSSSPLQEMMEEENACMIAAVQGTSSSELIRTIHEEAPGSELFEVQKRGPYIQEIQAFLKDGTIPADKKKARKLVFQAPLFTVLDKVLYFIDQTKDGAKRIFFPQAFDNTSWKNTTVGCMVDISVDLAHSANWHAVGGGRSTSNLTIFGGGRSTSNLTIRSVSPSVGSQSKPIIPLNASCVLSTGHPETQHHCLSFTMRWHGGAV